MSRQFLTADCVKARSPPRGTEFSHTERDVHVGGNTAVMGLVVTY